MTSRRQRSSAESVRITPAVTAFELRGQLYAVTAWEARERADGSTGKKVVMHTVCAECGQPFEFWCTGVFRHLTRRCSYCRKPGLPVRAPPANDRRAELIRQAFATMEASATATGATLFVPTDDGDVEEIFLPRPRPGRRQ